ncbi:hypothetical protein ACWIUD_06100 [Helicobacter sp. 23-1044]
MSLRGSLSEAKTTKQSTGLDKETSASPCFANKVKQPSKSRKSKRQIKSTTKNKSMNYFLESNPRFVKSKRFTIDS